MAEPISISDPGDPRLSDYVGLTDPDLRRRVEADGGYFIAESPLVVRRLIASGRTLRSVLVTPPQHDALVDVLEPLDAPVFVAAPEILRQVVGFDLHRGAVAAAERWALPGVADVLGSARRVAVLQRVNDHENIGVLFRSAAALGVDAVLLDGECSDPLYRRSVRVSIGSVLSLPWTRVDHLDQVRAAGFTTVALTPDPQAVDIATVEWPERAAVLFGAEGPGLTDDWLAASDVRAAIPMQGGIDSLNVATAAAIVFYVSRAARR